MTGCARFFLVMIVLAPLAYIGASYFQGEDGIENVKKIFQFGNSSEDSDSKDTYQNASRDLQKQLDKVEKENAELKRQIRQKDAEIKILKEGKEE